MENRLLGFLAFMMFLAIVVCAYFGVRELVLENERFKECTAKDGVYLESGRCAKSENYIKLGE